MCRTLTSAIALMFSLAGSSHAGVPAPAASNLALASPDPARSFVVVSEPGAACQYRFRSDGGLDRLTLFVTLRDPFDAPVEGCSTSAGVAAIHPRPGEECWSPEEGAVFSSCDGDFRSAFSDSGGALQFVWSRIGGRGIARICVTAQCVGTIEVYCGDFEFTSPDLDGSGSVTVIDLGIWASCLAPSSPCRSSDYDCSCSVNMMDLAIFAGGMTPTCDD